MMSKYKQAIMPIEPTRLRRSIMGMKLQTAPNYIKKGELEEETYAFERLMYIGSTVNTASKYPGTDGAINHNFVDGESQNFTISGDKVMNAKLEERGVVEGMHVGLFYHGKKDPSGQPVKYHRWSIALDEDEQKAIREAKTKSLSEPVQTNMNLDDLE